MRLFSLFLLALFCAACSPTPSTSSAQSKTVVLVPPLPHKAMDEIADGFKEVLNAPEINIKIMNAQGDPNIMRTIFQQLEHQPVDTVLPIGTSATQMAHAMLPKQRVIGLAADLTPDCNLSVVDDDISKQKQAEFLHAVFPDLKQLVILHSSDDKIYPEIKAFRAEAEQFHIQVKTVLVLNLVELPNVLSQLPKETQGIFLLKDHLLVSAIPVLKQFTQKNHIPLITSDEGSIAEGGDVALGVREKDIGREGAKLLQKIWADNSKKCMNERVILNQLTVFVGKSLSVEDVKRVRDAATERHYSVVSLGS